MSPNPNECMFIRQVFCDNYLDGGYHVPYAHKGLASGLQLDSYSTKVSSLINLSQRFHFSLFSSNIGLLYCEDLDIPVHYDSWNHM